MRHCIDVVVHRSDKSDEILLTDTDIAPPQTHIEIP